MKTEEIQQAEKIVMERFNEMVRKEFPSFPLSDKYSGYLYVHSGRAHITMFVECYSEHLDIRLECPTEDHLQVGFGSNGILTTHQSDHDDAYIDQIHVLSNIFQNEERWRKLICSLDVSPIVKAVEEKEAEDKRRAEEKRQTELKAFEDAGIEVGTFLEDVKYGNRKQVLRMSRTKIQVGGQVYSKQEVGAYLLEGKWQVGE